MTKDELLKIAYARGVEAALEDSGMEKDAFIGPLLGWIGRGAAKGIGRLAGKPPLGQRLMAFGKGATRGSLLGGTFTGGMSALSAPEGERGEAFLRGFLPGAVGFGPGWQLGSRLGRLGAERGLWALTGTGAKGARAFSSAVQRAGRPVFSQRRLSNLLPWHWGKRALPRKAGMPLVQETFKDPRGALKTLGSKALLTGIPFGTAMLGSSIAEAPVSALTQKAPTAIEAPTAAAVYHAGRQAMGRGFGLTSEGQVYPVYPSNYGYGGGYY